MIIARCGYSTVMDLAALQKRSILIPTPGQTEQEYLAEHLMKKNFAFCVEQKKFRLKTVLPLAEAFPYNLDFDSENKLPFVVHSLIEAVRRKRGSVAEPFV
jgi:predicted glycosyltransferase